MMCNRIKSILEIIIHRNIFSIYQKEQIKSHMKIKLYVQAAKIIYLFGFSSKELAKNIKVLLM